MNVALDELTGEHRDGIFEDRGLALDDCELNAQRAGLGDQRRLLVGVEVPVTHMGDVGFGVRAPGAHRVRVFPRVAA